MNYVELSSGHVFAKGSVRAVTPVEKGDTEDEGIDYSPATFRVVGVGFIVNIHIDFDIYDWQACFIANQKAESLRKEAIEKLLNNSTVTD